ncbi:carboxypeptidase-like regulatory domain-containing protein [Flaviaesturariibacter aridisoli]|uniref:Carboxypeptidase regulatory-like domain-containing protein n=1 Tax=Flaviaesturariibacter aridisoli TaxID=2545761 RepID=A0A4R4E5Z9_9BACT|nr:carboxypeptidase-like regulatory domain-containing protein [Flaviaesturariibacter aridisoli]TCZ74909.1 carboxypeptidase regulatory-like domain-containing protein [Flaviaesturariibacter aridisoli]
MNKRNLARVGMLDVMLLFFLKYAATIDRLPALRAAVNRFIDFLKQTKRAMEEEKLVSSGITTDKEKQRDLLSKDTLVIAGAAAALAHEKGDAVLEGEMTLSRRDLDRLPGADFLAKVRRVATVASGQLASLEDYGIRAAVLNSFNTLADIYDGKAPAPRAAINLRSDAGELAAELVAQTNAILKKTIDKLVLQFEKTDPEFYAQYWKSRIIVDAATSGTSLVIDVSGPDAQPLAAAEVRIEGTGVKGITDAHGKCILKDLEPGTKKITIAHRDYTQKTLEDVKLKAGKSNKVKAAL